MTLSRYDRIVLTVIAMALVALVAWRSERVARADSMGKVNFTHGGGVGIACSADGKHVYVAGTEGIIVSDDYGRVGSWQKTVKED